MSRVKRGVMHNKRRHSILKHVKGFRWGRSHKISFAQTASKKAGENAYRGRKQKKRDFRAVWQTRISAAAKLCGLSYSKLIDKLKKNQVELDRKILSTLAAKEMAVFKQIVEKLK